MLPSFNSASTVGLLGSATADAIVYLGGNQWASGTSIGGYGYAVKAPPESAMAWLDRRVDEMRVRL